MEVKFRLKNEKLRAREIFQLLLKEFKRAKELDDLDIVSLKEKDDYVEYTTCCNNTWSLELKDNDVYFGYKGTRAGLRELAPFTNLRWALDYHRLQLIQEWQEVYIQGLNVYEPIPKRVIEFDIEKAEYHTSAPKEWHLQPFDLLERLQDDPSKAVIIDQYNVPRAVVPYKNVYAPS